MDKSVGQGCRFSNTSKQLGPYKQKTRSHLPVDVHSRDAQKGKQNSFDRRNKDKNNYLIQGITCVGKTLIV